MAVASFATLQQKSDLCQRQKAMAVWHGRVTVTIFCEGLTLSVLLLFSCIGPAV